MMKKSVNKVTAIVMSVLVVAMMLPVDKGSQVSAGEVKQTGQAKQEMDAERASQSDIEKEVERQNMKVQQDMGGAAESVEESDLEIVEEPTPVELPEETPTPTELPPMEILPDMTEITTVKDGVIYGKEQISLPVTVKNLVDNTSQELSLQKSSYSDTEEETYDMTSYEWQSDGTVVWKNNLADDQQMMIQEIYNLQVKEGDQVKAAKDLTVVWDHLAPEITLSYSQEELEELAQVRSENITLNYQAIDPSYPLADDQEIPGIGVEKVYAEFESSIPGGQVPDTVESNPEDEGSITLNFQNISQFHGICRLYAVDYLGNISKPVELELHIDREAPKVVITGGRSSQWEKEITITAKVTDYCFPENTENVFWYVMEGDNTPQYDGITWQKNEQESTEFEQVYDITVVVSKEKYPDYNGNCTIYAKDKMGNTLNAVSEDNQFIVMFDSTAPEFSGVSITDEKKNPLEAICNKLSFGMFFQDKIRIEVSAADIKKNNAFSGIYEVTLLADGEQYTPVDTEGIGTESCKVVFLLEKEKKYSSFSFTVTDNAGNTTEKTMGQINSLLDTPGVYLDGTAPSLSITAQEKGVNTHKDNEERNWYQNDITFQVEAGDNLAGIQKIQVEINGKKIEKDYNGKPINDGAFQTEVITRKEFTVSTSQANPQKTSQGGEDGRYDLNVQVTDNAGNVTTESQTVYIDTTSPYIKSVEVSGTGSLEGNGKLTTANTYGYFVQGTVQLLVTAADDMGSSGIESITYYTVNYNNNKDGEKKDEEEIGVDENGQVKIELSDDFRGVVYLKATDNVKNTSKEYKRLQYIIIGTKKNHEKQAAIEITLPETTSKDVNGNPLYSQNVTAKIKVKDADMGLGKVTWSVTSDQDKANNQSSSITVDANGKISDTNLMQAVSRDKNLVTEAEGQIQIANDSNNICVTVELTDRAGMTYKKEINLSIDKQKPVIEVTYDNQNAQESYLGEGEYYKEDRTATVVIRERNFNSAKVQVKITNEEGEIPSVTDWEKAENASAPDQTTYTARVAFTTDGKYTLEVTGEDTAGNQAESYQGETFIVDKTKPVTEISWDDVEASNGSYYKDSRRATITIKEHNFDQSKVQLTSSAANGAEAGSFPSISSFQSEGDVHKASIEFAEDGTYSFEIAYSDKAGNEAEVMKAESFSIDKTEPELFFQGVEDKGAYKEDVSPVIVCRDENLDVSTLKAQVNMVTQDNSVIEVQEVLGETETTGDTCMMTLNNPEHVRENDGIYVVTASVLDLAGNTHEETIVYSVNRFGSVYTLQEEAKRVAGSYVKSSQAISIVETNADEISAGDVKVKLTKNGQAAQLTEGKDYTRTENVSDGSWKQYTYTISEDNFKEDGIYMVSISTKDRAGNYNENASGEEESAELWFGVDKTSPVIVPLNFQPKQSYNLTGLEAEMEVQDNLKLAGVKVYVNNEEVELKQDEEQEHYTFNLPESTQEQNIRIVASDAAGNEMVREVNGIYITTNPWVRFVHSKKAVAAAVGAAAVVVLAAVAVVIWRKKQKQIAEER